MGPDVQAVVRDMETDMFVLNVDKSGSLIWWKNSNAKEGFKTSNLKLNV